MAEDRDMWTESVLATLGSLTREDVPAVEYRLIDALATWLFSDANRGSDYEQDDAGQVVSALLYALDAAADEVPGRVPDDDGPIGPARDRLVEGAHELAALGLEGRGVTKLITRAMPAMRGELNGNAGEPGAQLLGGYLYLLLAVATGTDERAEPEVVEGLVASFHAWDALFAAGEVVASAQA